MEAETMQDAWRAYLELALGLTEASRKKAAQVVKSLAEQSGGRVEDLQGMAEDLLSTGMANRENVLKMVRLELDRALGKVGLATSEEVAELTSRVQQLEMQLRQAREQADAAERAAAAAAAAGEPVKKAAKAATAKKSSVKKTTAKKTTGRVTTKKAAPKKAAKKVVKKSTTKGGR
jgi:polyhydroxyalkanoate synthesis regulator phasin